MKRRVFRLKGALNSFNIPFIICLSLLTQTAVVMTEYESELTRLDFVADVL